MKGFHLVDLSKPVHHVKHFLKKHIKYPKRGDQLTHQNVMEHIGHHEMPHGRHRISVHHHEGQHEYYDQEFGSHDEAQNHVKTNFKFLDAFPKTKEHIKQEFTNVAKEFGGHFKEEFKKREPLAVEAIHSIKNKELTPKAKEYVKEKAPLAVEAVHSIKNKELTPKAKEYVKEKAPLISETANLAKHAYEKGMSAEFGAKAAQHVGKVAENLGAPKTSEVANLIGEGISAYTESRLPEYIQHKVAPYVQRTAEQFKLPGVSAAAGAYSEGGISGLAKHVGGALLDRFTSAFETV